jgi:hypothetical protein
MEGTAAGDLALRIPRLQFASRTPTPPIHQHEGGPREKQQSHPRGFRVDLGDFAAPSAPAAASATTPTTAPTTAPAARPAAAGRRQTAVRLGGLDRRPIRIVFVVRTAAIVRETPDQEPSQNEHGRCLKPGPPISPNVGTGNHRSSPGSGRTAVKHSFAHDGRKRYGQSERAPFLGRRDNRTNPVPGACLAHSVVVNR